MKQLQRSALLLAIEYNVYQGKSVLECADLALQLADEQSVDSVSVVQCNHRVLTELAVKFIVVYRNVYLSKKKSCRERMGPFPIEMCLLVPKSDVRMLLRILWGFAFALETRDDDIYQDLCGMAV